MIKRKKIEINNDLRNVTQKAKDRATRTPLKPGVNTCASEKLVATQSSEHNIQKEYPERIYKLKIMLEVVHDS